MMGYKLYVRDQYFNKVAEIEDYQKLEATLRFNGVGAWVLELPTNCDAAREIIKPKSGIIVVRNGITLFSGPVHTRNRKWDNSDDKLTISGFDDMIWLSRFLAYPVPSGPPYTSQDYDVRTGNAESIMKAYVDANIGANARSERKINITTETDKGLGAIVIGRARFQTLLDLFVSLSLAGGDLGFKVIQVNKALQFQVYQSKDNTQSVVFSPLLGNLLDFEYTDADPETNYLIIGGQGEGTARTFIEQGDSNGISTYGRSESFLDRRDTSDTNELIQAADEELTQKANKTSLSITPIDTDGVSFGSDYNLGDKVSVVLTQPNDDGGQDALEVISDVVRELKITITRDGELISPFIGTPDSLSHPILGIFSKMKKLNKRLSNLERR
jgi:hypothetical protein